MGRRDALKLFTAGLAASLAGCDKPNEEIVPYVEMPERLVPGLPLRFATTLPLSGYGRGVIVTSMEGRPIKVDGNPRHPASLGATDVFAEAAVLSLYDPDRSKTVRGANGVASWTSFEKAWLARVDKESARRGAGLRLVTGRVTSPTLKRQIDALLKLLPEARWYRYEPLGDDAAADGAVQAFGRPVTVIPRIADASVVFTFDADPLGPGPAQLHHARGFAARRLPAGDREPARIYALESSWTLTGASADHRLAQPPAAIHNAAIAMAAKLGAPLPSPPTSPELDRLIAAASADLEAHLGTAIVLAGPTLPAEVHALCHWINRRLQAPLDLIEPVDPVSTGHAAALSSLANELAAGAVETLILLDVNPVYNAPSALKLADAIRRVPFAVHAGAYDDETGAVCGWHLPLSHALESWSDLRAFDGTTSIVQPLIRPLHDTRTAHEILALLQRQSGASSYVLVRESWGERTSADFEAWWRQSLHNGVIENSAAQLLPTLEAKLPRIAPASRPDGITLVVKPDPSLWDGGFANNPWLQECPKPLTTELWGNALQIAPRDAVRLRLRTGDVVRVMVGSAAVETPVLVRDGQAARVAVLTTGYGRSRAGAIGTGVGCNAFQLRGREGGFEFDEADFVAVRQSGRVLTLQHEFRIDGEPEDIFPIVSVQELSRLEPGDLEHDPDPPSILTTPQGNDPYAWAMVIDTSLCIGCNACVIACQAENNVPVIGPEEVARGRDMHWLRVDSYERGPKGQPRPGFQPVPCMHCEHAPCEPVCPVAASVHDGEGLNVQVYNRCVGTRFCEANCPYKVRRFNFFSYSGSEAYATLDAALWTAQRNPDVSVRGRGVMEKCTYCVQRISRARRTAEKENRSIADGEVVTACAAACPTRAIVFGNRNDAEAAVTVKRQDPRHYTLLGHLGTRPRTTYLARLRNANPDLEEPGA
jgi:Fe-S-cluster-containing dehydrogenase component